MATSETGRKFHFIREIASGGFGSVFLAKVSHGDGFSRLAAIKLLHAKWSENEDVASRIRDEARLLGWLRHRNIVEVIDLTMIDGRWAVIMEYLEAVDLRVVVNQWERTGEVLPVRPMLELCACVASALDAAYNRPPYAGEKPLKVVHRDIKPSNVMVDGTGEVKVLDFGVARADFEHREAHTQEMSFGSLEYMPPERLFFEPEGHHSDVYSLGVTLFEALALEKLGKAKLRPDQHAKYLQERWTALAERHAGLDPEVATELRELLLSMLAFDEEDRPGAGEACTRLRAIARRLSDQPGLQEWAEGALPPLIEAYQNRTREREDDSLVDRVLTEDTWAFRHGVVNTDSDAVARAAVVSAEPGGEDEALEHTGADDRWNALKQATLAELEEPGTRRTVSGGREKVVSSGPAPSPIEDAGTEEAGVGPLALVGALLMGGALLLLGVVAVVAVGVGGMRARQATAVVPPPVAAVEARAPEEQPVPDGPSATFVSAWPDTRKLTVRCDGAEAEGVERAVLPVEGAGSCTVLALDTRRKRLTAVLDEVEPREYRCFADGDKDCR